ncbi:MAG: cell wall protein, partial [Hungatella hathewayi]|nr:cell wall protein [Hungatella hathewayi]
MAWVEGKSSKGLDWVEHYANDGFMSLANIPPGCKSPNDIFKVVSQYTADSPLWIGKIQSGPGVVDKQKLYDIAGLSDWDTFRKYCSVSTDTPGAMAYMDADGLWWSFPGEIGGVQRPVTIKVTYDPSVFRVLEVTGSLEYFECSASGSQQLYRAKGDVKESNPIFYISTTSVPGTNPPGGGGGSGGGGDNTGGEISVEIYQHEETFESHYNVELNKYDYETGKPLEKSTWQMLEKFDDGQLSSDETDGGIVEEKMREDPTTWADWLVFEDDMETDASGHISHSDTRYYDFAHQYCDGHPIPPEPEIEEGDGGEGGDSPGGEDSGEDDAMAEYEALMEEWQAAVDECESVAASSGGTFHHWECGSEDTPSEDEAFESSGCRGARDAAYETFINLEYSYTFRETNARDGYILHGQNGHPDDVPVEIITTAASEADRTARWSSTSNIDIVVSGFLRNMEKDTKAAAVSLSYEEEDLPIETVSNAIKEEHPIGPGYAVPEKRGPGYSATSADAVSEDGMLELAEAYELSPFQEMINRFLRFFGLPEFFAEEQGATVKMTAHPEEEDEKEYPIATNTNAETDYETASSSNASYENDDYGYMTMDLEWEELEALDATPSNASYSFARACQPSKQANIMLHTARAGGGYINPDSATTDSQPEADKGPDDNMAHRFVVYDHRVPGQIHFKKRDLALAAGEHAAYDSYGDSQGDATLEGAVYGLFAADDIYGPDTQRDGDGNVTGGSGILFDANDLVAVAATDKNGEGSFLTITEKPHSTYNYKTGQIEYSGKAYPKNLYTQNGFVKTYPQEETGRIYTNNEGKNGDCWIGRPLVLGNYYIKELTRSEGYELSITGKDMAVSNVTEAGRADYGENAESKSSPKGSAWITGQLSHAVTFASGNDAYGNRENLLNVEVTSKDTTEGYNIVLDGLPDNADFYYNGVTLTPVKVQVPDGGSWVDAAEAPLYETAQDGTVFKRTIDGNLIEKPGAVPSVPVSYTVIASEAKKLPSAGTVTATNPVKYQAAYSDTSENFKYVKYELEQMMRSIGMSTPKEGNRYSELNYPVYDIHTTVNGKEVFGMPEVTIELSGATTNKSVIDTLLDYYVDNAVFTYGGLQKLEEKNGTLLATIVVGMTPSKDFLYETDGSGNITAAYLFRLNETYGRYMIRKYTGSEVTVNAVASATGTKYRVQVTPDYTVDDTGIPSDRYIYGSDTDRYLCYSAGDILYDYWYQDGSGNWTGHAPLRRKVYQPNYKEVTIQEETVTASKVPRVNSLEEVVDQTGSTFVIYDDSSKQYTLHVGTKDASLTGTKVSSFTAALPDGSTVLTQADIDKIGDKNVWGYSVGDTLNNSEYIIRIAGAGAGVFASKDFDRDKHFIRNQRLIYNGNHDLCEDGNTNVSPAPVLERIISQQIKVTKSIDASSYEDANSYSEIHEDWFTKLFGGFLAKNTAASKMDNFRFKVYLKSNLETLYRDEEGGIIWLDRKGKEINVLSDKEQYPALVPKIYTKVPHVTAPLYQDSNDAITANDALYGYTGQIHEEQNPGYTSVLEMADQLVEDGTGTRIIHAYNYEKFFDALAVANHDKWDDNAPTYTSWQPIGNQANRTEASIDNARASDMVRQFAIDWYLKDEIAKLVRPVAIAPDEKEKGAGDAAYTDELYDMALAQAIRKTENYLKPFFSYDLDEIYSIAWDSAADGGADSDETTLSADTLYGDAADNSEGYYFGTSAYLPYGTYIVAEQQPRYADLEDFKNRHYQIDKPKEVTLPSVYADYAGSQASPEVMNRYYHYSAVLPLAQMEQKYHIRFNEEAPHVIHGRNADGDFEVYKYGLNINAIRNGGEGAGAGDYYSLTQDEWKPYKNYYNAQDDRTTGDVPYYLSEGLGGRIPVSKYYRYSSVSEQKGTADNVPYPDGPVTEENAAGIRYRYNVGTMKGKQTAYEGRYAAVLVPWSVSASDNSVTEVEDSKTKPDGESSYKGFAYTKLRNRFFSSKLRIEKLDSETHENILHDDAIFNIYAAERDDSPGGTGQVKFYEEDTTIAGSLEFLTAMGAVNIAPLMRSMTHSFFLESPVSSPPDGPGTLYSGQVPAGTPVCKESEQIILTDRKGSKTGDFKSFTTTRDGLMKDMESGNGLFYADQNTGYLETPQPLGAGVYVLCEMKPPSGYVRTRPVAIEIYSDAVTYYKEGNRDSRVAAAIYEYPSDNPTAHGNKPQDMIPMARINVENTPIKLTVEKVKESSVNTADTTKDKTVTYKVSGRVDGSLTRIGNNPSYEYAYENGEYLGYAWQKGTLEYLEARKAAGENVDIVYNGRTFAGYGYVTRTLETADDTNPYVAGAVMTLFEAIELKPSGDREDYAYEGLVMERSGTGNITRMYLKQGYAGQRVEFVQKIPDDADEEPYWAAKMVERGDTDILYYDLDSLDIFTEERISGGTCLYGYNRDRTKISITQLESDKALYGKSDTEPSIFAFKGGVP